MIAFGTQYWSILLLAILLAAAGIALLLYFKNKQNSELSKTQLRILMSLRFVSFFFIAFLLLSPFLRSLKRIVQAPIIITAWDNSASMTTSPDSLRIGENIRAIQNEVEQKLSEDFDVVSYIFGNDVEQNKPLNFEAKTSDYSKLIQSINDIYFNQNIGALIIGGDGIFNRGENPLNMVDNVGFPVYTIGFGDTTTVADSRIQNLSTNRTAFAGNKFPVEVDVQFSKARNKTLKLSILHNDTELAHAMLTPPNDNYFTTKEFILDADTPGLQHYTARIETLKNEPNTSNNSYDFVVNILENKQKILILSDGWHPDIGAIKNTLEEQKSYDVSVFTEDPYPNNPDQFNLLVLNQLPTSRKSISTLIKKAEKSRIPLLYIVGNKTFLPQFNILVPEVQIVPLAGSGEEAQATINPAYATFKLSDDFRETLPKFPPLQVPFADYDLAEGYTPLFYQKLKNIETGKPLIATGKTEGRKIGFIFGEGLWRWRLFDYYQNQSHSSFYELINQLIQYLSLRENEDNFIIDYKPIYAETDDIILNAEVYNDAYERVTDGEVNITITNSLGEEFDFTFDKQVEDYYLNAGLLPVGDYSFNAEVTLGNETYSEKGNFTIVAVNLEQLITQAQHNTLYQLADLTGGAFYLPDKTAALIAELKSDKKPKATSYYQEMVSELLNLRWIFFIVLLLLSVEWFLRKYWGVY